MDALEVHGGATLAGEVGVAGAKNSALKLMAAALLAEGDTRLERVPDIADVAAMRAVLEHLGVAVARDGETLTCSVGPGLRTDTPPHLVQRLRASIVVLGPLLARHGHARLAQPGGCDLGHRGIDLHLQGLEMLGARITRDADAIVAEAPPGGLVAGDFELPYASVGATENLLMAAVCARGVTVIGNAAREPEIVDLAAMLQAMGARIEGAGTEEIRIEGVAVEDLRPTTHRVVGDRIEAGTYAVAGALCGGEVTVRGVDPAHLRLPLEKLAEAGASVDTEPGAVTVRRERGLRAIDVATLPFPGFPTDLQPPVTVLLTQAAGTAMVTENVFDSRFRLVEELRALGADAELAGHHAIIRGPSPLRGAAVRATDLRAGAALVLAGLCASGTTLVRDAAHIERGYMDLPGKLAALGARVRRVPASQPASQATPQAAPVGARA